MTELTEKTALRVLLTGGGTGGHVYPTLALYQILQTQWKVADVLYVGSRGRAEETIVTRAGIPIRYVHSAPISGVSLVKILRAFWDTAIGVGQAIPVLLRFRPHLIIAAGGYVSAPIVFASLLLRPFLRPKLVIDEQNVVPGLMNKVASLFADVILVSFPETPYYVWNNRCVHTGYPVREEFVNPRGQSTAKLKVKAAANQPLVLVWGGSMGARSINRLMAEALPMLAVEAVPLTIIHATGLAAGSYQAWDDTVKRLEKAAATIGSFQSIDGGMELTVNGGRFVYRVLPYLYDMAGYLAAADLVICRAGAGAITELLAQGKASILIPKRDLPGDHQELNAISVAEKGGCEVVFERRTRDSRDYIALGDFLDVFTHLIKNPSRLKTIGERAASQFQCHYQEKILDTFHRLLLGGEIDYVLEILEPRSVKLQRQVDVLMKFLRDQPSDSLYARFYSIKIEEYLQSNRWETVNKGIKLCGALRRIDKIPVLVSLYDSRNGFIRRNILAALAGMDFYDPLMLELIDRALDDPYFEARSGGVDLAGRLADQVVHRPEIVQKIRRVFLRRWERYEVRANCIRALPLFEKLSVYCQLVDRYRFHRNVRLREAVLDGIRLAFEKGIIRPAETAEVRNFIKDFLITTSDFKPNFSIRESYMDLYRSLSANHDSDRTEGGAS